LELPFDDDAYLRIQELAREGKRAVIHPSVTGFHRNLIERCCDLNPAVRPTFAEIVADPDRLMVEGCEVPTFNAYKVDGLRLQ
jgi:hypothetical protein